MSSKQKLKKKNYLFFFQTGISVLISKVMASLDLEEQIAEAISRDGGAISLSLLPVRETWLRKKLGDRKLLTVLRGRDDLFEITGESIIQVKLKNQSSYTVDDIQINKSSSELLDWVQFVLETKGPILKLPHIASNKLIKKRLHQYTRTVGCDHPAFSTEWWDDASEKLISLLTSDKRFIVSNTTDNDLRMISVTLHNDFCSKDDSDDVFVDTRMDSSIFLDRISYLLRQSGRVARCNEIQKFSLQLSKLGSDEQLQKVIKGRPLSSVINHLDMKGILSSHNIEVQIAETKKGSLTVLSLSCDSVKSKSSENKNNITKELCYDVLFEELPLFIAVHKPTGVTTEQVAEYYYNSDKYKKYKSEKVDTVSRIDRGTSGVLVLPLSTEGETLLGDHFRASRVTKTYICLVSGEIPESGSIDSKLLLVDSGSTYKSFVSPKGKDAFTSFKRLNIFRRQGGIYSLVETHPKTGRTHQIRAHLSSIGHPLVGDAKYAGEKRAKRHSKWCGRLFLHAASIEFPSYDVIAAPLADDLQNVLTFLSTPTE